MKFKNIVYIQGQISKIYQLFYNIKNWPSVLPHVKAVEMISDDGINQHLIMDVSSGGKIEKLETYRNCKENEKISFHQPFPPHPLKIHKGEWQFFVEQQRVKVIAEHNIEVKFPSLLNAVFSWVAWNFFIKKNSMATLTTIKNTIERDKP